MCGTKRQTKQCSRTKATTTKHLDEDASTNVHEKLAAAESSSTRASQVSVSECPRKQTVATGCALKAQVLWCKSCVGSVGMLCMFPILLCHLVMGRRLTKRAQPTLSIFAGRADACAFSALLDQCCRPANQQRARSPL